MNIVKRMIWQCSRNHYLQNRYSQNQVSKRGWTTESIADAINNPVKVGESVNKYTGNSVTLYYVDDIHYVAVDDVTGKVIQVANLTESTWKMSGK